MYVADYSIVLFPKNTFSNYIYFSFEDLSTPSESSKIEDEDKQAEGDNSKPQLDTQKEKQCWDLYKKMSEKGVSVSFDTILRGMLTPTEYRLHRKQSLVEQDNC